MASQQLPSSSGKSPRIVDFTPMGIDKTGNQLEREKFDSVAHELWQAFAEDGIVYLKNHGMKQTDIDCAFAAADQFFALPDEVKSKYLTKRSETNDDTMGYVPIDGERLRYNDTVDGVSDVEDRVEHRECFNITTTNNKKMLPEEEVAGFTATIKSFFGRCTLLALRVLRAIAIELKLEDEDHFAKTHLPMDIFENYSLMRLINYPPISAEAVQDSSVRCGEHSDYGSITLLFQDEAGGLEGKSRSGEYKQVTPIPGTVVVNIGNILQHQTSGQLLSVKHRVLVNNDEERIKRRRSITFFVHPVHETLLYKFNSPTVDPNPINAQDFVQKRFATTYRV